MWSLRWHFTNKSVTGAPYSIKSYSLSHSWTLWWRVRWLKQCRLEVAAELQQRWRRTSRRRKSIPRSSSSHREGSVTQATQRGASCGRYDQRRRRKLRRRRREPTLAVKWRVSARYDGAVPIRQRYARTHNRNWILSGTFSQCIVHGEVELHAPTSLRRTRDERRRWRQTAAVVTVVRKYPTELSCSNPPLSPQVHAVH